MIFFIFLTFRLSTDSPRDIDTFLFLPQLCPLHFEWPARGRVCGGAYLCLENLVLATEADRLKHTSWLYYLPQWYSYGWDGGHR